MTWKSPPCGLPPRSPKAPSTGGKHPWVLSYDACKPQQQRACGMWHHKYFSEKKRAKKKKIKRNISYKMLMENISLCFVFLEKAFVFFFWTKMFPNAKFQIFLISFIIIAGTSSPHFLFVCILRNPQELVALFHPFICKILDLSFILDSPFHLAISVWI